MFSNTLYKIISTRDKKVLRCKEGPNQGKMLPQLVPQILKIWEFFQKSRNRVGLEGFEPPTNGL